MADRGIDGLETDAASFDQSCQVLGAKFRLGSKADSRSFSVSPCTCSWRMESQSLTTKPSKFHSSRNTWRNRKALAEAGTPLRSEKEGIRVATPASTAALNGGR